MRGAFGCELSSRHQSPSPGLALLLGPGPSALCTSEHLVKRRGASTKGSPISLHGIYATVRCCYSGASTLLGPVRSPAAPAACSSALRCGGSTAAPIRRCGGDIRILRPAL